MTFEEFLELFKTSKYILKLENTPEFKLLYDEITKNGLRFPVKARTAEEAISDSYEKYILASERNGKTVILFCALNDERVVIDPKTVSLNYSVAEELKSILNV